MSNHLPLRAKVAELVDLADMIGLPLELVAECMVRMMDGHREHGDAHASIGRIQIVVSADELLNSLFILTSTKPHWYLAGPIVGANGDWRYVAKESLSRNGLGFIDPVRLTDGIVADPSYVPVDLMRNIVLPLDTCAVSASFGLLVHINGGFPTGTIREIVLARQFGKHVVVFGDGGYMQNNTMRAMASAVFSNVDDALSCCFDLSKR